MACFRLRDAGDRQRRAGPIVEALHAARARDGKPHAIVLRTHPGFEHRGADGAREGAFSSASTAANGTLMSELDREEANRG